MDEPTPFEAAAYALLAECRESFRLTREYVGERMLPAVPGWSWFDTVNRIDDLLDDRPRTPDERAHHEMVQSWSTDSPMRSPAEAPSYRPPDPGSVNPADLGIDLNTPGDPDAVLTPLVVGFDESDLPDEVELDRRARVDNALAATAGVLPEELLDLLIGPEPIDDEAVAAWIREHGAWDRHDSVTDTPDAEQKVATGALHAAGPEPEPPGVRQMHNRIRIGVRPWDKSEHAEVSPDRDWSASIGVHWVEIDGVRIPGNVVHVKIGKMGMRFQTVDVRFIAGKIETVPESEWPECLRCGRPLDPEHDRDIDAGICGSCNRTARILGNR